MVFPTALWIFRPAFRKIFKSPGGVSAALQLKDVRLICEIAESAVACRSSDKPERRRSDGFPPLFPLAAGAAIVAATAYALADRQERIAPRLDRAAVEAMLRKADLYEPMRVLGKWK